MASQERQRNNFDKVQWLQALLAAATWFSLFLLGIVVTFWARSYFVEDRFSHDGWLNQLDSSVGVLQFLEYRHPPPRETGRPRFHWLSTDPTVEETTLGFAFGRPFGPPDLRTRIAVPYWALAILFALLPSRQLSRARRANRALHLARTGRCQSCGYDLRAITTNRCPECGADVRPVWETSTWA